MPRAAVLLALLLLVGCAARIQPERPAAGAVTAIVPTTTGTWQDNVAAGALLAAMAYGAGPDHARLEHGGYEGLRALMPGLSIERRLELFAEAGLRAEYFAPRLWIMPWVRYPETWVLGNPADQSLCVVFTGSNDVLDWYQNAKTSVYEDQPSAGRPYIPSGHAGFRRGVRNLIAEGFFDAELPRLCREWGISAPPGGRIPVFVAGHSLGAAIAQLSLPCLEGWRHTGEPEADGFFGLEDRAGLFEVRGAYLIAPPYAIASDEFMDRREDVQRWRRNAATWEWMQRTYGQRSWNVIHEADVVCAIYDVRNIHEVSMKHFGRLIRIDGSGRPRLEETPWRNLRPHDYWEYVRALQALPR